MKKIIIVFIAICFLLTAFFGFLIFRDKKALQTNLAGDKKEEKDNSQEAGNKAVENKIKQLDEIQQGLNNAEQGKNLEKTPSSSEPKDAETGNSDLEEKNFDATAGETIEEETQEKINTLDDLMKNIE